MRRVFRKLFRVLRHPLTAMVAFLYVGWAVWQAPAGTLVGDLKPGIRIQEPYSVLSNQGTLSLGRMYPVGNELEIFDTEFECRLGDLEPEAYESSGLVNYIILFEYEQYGFINTWLSSAIAEVGFYTTDSNVASVFHETNSAPLDFPLGNRDEYVDALFKYFWPLDKRDAFAEQVLDQMYASARNVAQVHNKRVFTVDVPGVVLDTFLVLCLIFLCARLWMAFLAAISGTPVQMLLKNPVAGTASFMGACYLLVTSPHGTRVGYWIDDLQYTTFDWLEIPEWLSRTGVPREEHASVYGVVYPNMDSWTIDFYESETEIPFTQQDFRDGSVWWFHLVHSYYPSGWTSSSISNGELWIQLDNSDPTDWESNRLDSKYFKEYFANNTEMGDSIVDAIYSAYASGNGFSDDKLLRHAISGSVPVHAVSSNAINVIGFVMELAVPILTLHCGYSMWSFPLWLKRRRRNKRGQCLKCGYSLEGIEGGACPECGQDVLAK